jgi:hypothetical protein
MHPGHTFLILSIIVATILVWLTFQQTEELPVTYAQQPAANITIPQLKPKSECELAFEWGLLRVRQEGKNLSVITNFTYANMPARIGPGLFNMWSGNKTICDFFWTKVGNYYYLLNITPIR